MLAQGDEDEIEAVIDQSLRRIDSRSDQRAYLLGLVKAVAHKDTQRMEQLLLRAQAIETDAHEDRVLIGLGELAAYRGEFEQAERYLLRAHEADIHNVGALNALFSHYDRSQRYDEAVQRARDLIEADPEFDPFYGQWAALRRLSPRGMPSRSMQ